MNIEENFPQSLSSQPDRRTDPGGPAAGAQ